MKTFRFGINLRDAKSRADWQDKARKVEAIGYSALLVPDHLAPMLATVPAVVTALPLTPITGGPILPPQSWRRLV
jgi:alkanesulfonate monooxygenase SsuD/methylene tetrahydromethanopterin reductase-like flavin-dependent oxidoreductase (luciferase family)